MNLDVSFIYISDSLPWPQTFNSAQKEAFFQKLSTYEDFQYKKITQNDIILNKALIYNGKPLNESTLINDVKKFFSNNHSFELTNIDPSVYTTHNDHNTYQPSSIEDILNKNIEENIGEQNSKLPEHTNYYITDQNSNFLENYNSLVYDVSNNAQLNYDNIYSIIENSAKLEEEKLKSIRQQDAILEELEKRKLCEKIHRLLECNQIGYIADFNGLKQNLNKLTLEQIRKEYDALERKFNELKFFSVVNNSLDIGDNIRKHLFSDTFTIGKYSITINNLLPKIKSHISTNGSMERLVIQNIFDNANIYISDFAQLVFSFIKEVSTSVVITKNE